MQAHGRASWKYLGLEQRGEALFQAWPTKPGLGGLSWQDEGTAEPALRDWLLERSGLALEMYFAARLAFFHPIYGALIAPEINNFKFSAFLLSCSFLFLLYF